MVSGEGGGVVFQRFGVFTNGQILSGFWLKIQLSAVHLELRATNVQLCQLKYL